MTDTAKRTAEIIKREKEWESRSFLLEELRRKDRIIARLREGYSELWAQYESVESNGKHMEGYLKARKDDFLFDGTQEAE